MINSVRISSRKKRDDEPVGKSRDRGGHVGYHDTGIDGVNTDSMNHTGALTAVRKAQYSLSLLLTSPNSKGEPGNSIQQVGLTPEACNTKPKVSLVIGPKRSVSCEAINRRRASDEDTTIKVNVKQGQPYTKKFVRNKTIDTDYAPAERQKSKTLPRNIRTGTEITTPHPDYSSRSLPRKLRGHARPNENGHTHREYSSQSLPRSRTKSATDAPSKTPAWYKNMNKEMNTSMEKESHLSKLLASDVKKGVTSPLTQRSADRKQSATYEDAPRRLRDARFAANQPHRKSLPNIHASNFNFMAVNNNKSNTNTNATTSYSSGIQNKSRGPHSPKWETLTLVAAPGVPPDLLPSELSIPKPLSITVEYKDPPDFLELRKQEIKNREVEKEREEIRYQREKERLSAEEKLIERKTRDYLKIEEERRRLELKEEELKLKEQALSRQQKEHEERRLHKLKEGNLLRREQEERQLKLREEEIRRKEYEEMRLLKLKEEELKRKEEMLFKQEQELEELRLLKLKEGERKRLDKEERHLLKLKEEEERKRREAEEQRLQKLKEEEEREELERQRLLKLKQEELERKEQDEKRILKLKKELKRKEGELLRKEAEQREQQRLREEALKPKLPPFGKAKYSFHPQGSGELTFRKGEIITILEAIDENWIEGELNGKIGIFPVSYVELLHTYVKSSPDKGLNSKYLESSDSSLVDTSSGEREIIAEVDIPVENGPLGNNAEVIVIEEELNLETTPQDLIDIVDTAASCETKIEPGKAYAKYTFKAETESELSFKKGDEIVVVKRIDDNWYAGECNGDIGIFPSNYVKVTREPGIIETVACETEVEAELAVVPKLGSLTEKEHKAKEDSTMMNGHDRMDGTNIDDFIGQGDPHKAIYRYAATNEDEIELLLGDIVHVLEKCDDNWYVGTCKRTGAFGTFPGNYVVPVH